ncbi:MAG: 3-oxoacyl-[acyl-carrier protein] reductase [Crocinitomicaceae bacterium]|jgi:3-oxoacyl-[acyl-carrier protein] reductase
MIKSIVVVGASRGIGRAIVEELAANPDNHILALSRNVSKMDEAFASFSNVSCKAIDLAAEDVKAQCTSLFSDLSRIDALINNAGMLINKPFDQLTREDFLSTYNVNIFGVMETVQAALPKMLEAHIVNISSMGGFQGSVKFPGLTAYSTSKAALCNFTELFAEEYKETTIKMNCLCLGAAQTEMLEEAFPGYQAPVTAQKMAEFIVNFALTGHEWMNGKIIPVSVTTP